MGIYEPLLVLMVVLGIYTVTCILPPRLRRKYLWLIVVLILAVGVAGVGYQLLRGGLGSPPFQD